MVAKAIMRYTEEKKKTEEKEKERERRENERKKEERNMEEEDKDDENFKVSLKINYEDDNKNNYSGSKRRKRGEKTNEEN